MSFYRHRQLHNPVPFNAVLTVQKLENLLGVEPPTNKIRDQVGGTEGAIEARRLIVEAQKKFDAQQQEKAMQDTRIKDALAQWDDEDKSLSTTKENVAMTTTTQTTHTIPPQFGPGVSTSQTVFDYIRSNPYICSADVKDILTAQGFNKSSVDSLIHQMVRVGMISRDKDTKLTALQSKYTPIKSVPTGKVQHVRKAPIRKVPSQGIAALNPAPTPTTTVAPAPITSAPLLTAARVLEMLSVKEAHVLYRELQTMFEG